MEIYKFDKSWKNWFIGDFTPSVFRTKLFEIGVNNHAKNSYWSPHFHKIATEYTLILEGKMMIGDKIFEKDDIFVIPPMEIVAPVFLEDTRVLVVKIPSCINDKYIVKET